MILSKKGASEDYVIVTGEKDYLINSEENKLLKEKIKSSISSKNPVYTYYKNKRCIILLLDNYCTSDMIDTELRKLEKLTEDEMVELKTSILFNFEPSYPII